MVCTSFVTKPCVQQAQGFKDNAEPIGLKTLRDTSLTPDKWSSKAVTHFNTFSLPVAVTNACHEFVSKANMAVKACAASSFGRFTIAAKF